MSGDNVWTGEGMTQDDFMKKDQCILCDEQDAIVGKSWISSVQPFLYSVVISCLA